MENGKLAVICELQTWLATCPSRISARKAARAASNLAGFYLLNCAAVVVSWLIRGRVFPSNHLADSKNWIILQAGSVMAGSGSDSS